MADRTAAIQQLLVDAGCPGRIRVLPESTHSAAQATAALGCAPGAIASSLVFLAGGEPLLVMTSGVHRVDTDLLSTELGVPVEMARAKLVKEVTGQPIGGVSPIGHPAPLRTVVDRSLQAYDELWAAAGTANSVFPISFDDLVRITAGTVLPVVTG
ncbi:YbaK/EbsC family protein [Flexivirga caeni]|uniref:YbaK/EbsC family protein n=1 Tax=Flexivirga caeni TaxID=2294115 RepID=A0A3M9MFB0_9MICO|nr:YbaK/EbsC family protein [Flexivirga caeni]RNI23875.1 YbaK/EbsC family protein [Flexivirga caeni]